MAQVKFKGEPNNLVGPTLKPGDTAPDFECLTGLEIVKLANTPAKARIFSVVPSLDTGVCAMQTKKFSEKLNELKDKVAFLHRQPRPALRAKRFCEAEKIANSQNLSDVRNHSFGKNYGVLMEGLPLPLLARAIFVVDKNNKITYCEYVAEVTTEPNYDKALAALKAIAA